MKPSFPFSILQTGIAYTFVATHNMKTGTIIETSPTVRFSPYEGKLLETTAIGQYVTKERESWYLPFGYMGYLPLSTEGNVIKTFDRTLQVFEYKTIKHIQKGDTLWLQGGGTVNKGMPEESYRDLSPVTLPFTVGVSPILKIRGLIADQHIETGDVIERCPVIVFPYPDTPFIQQTLLQNYVFKFTGNSSAFAFGYGSLINHSYDPNARFMIHSSGWITFIARKDIHPKEEIMITYEGFDEEGNACRIHPAYFDFDRHLE